MRRLVVAAIVIAAAGCSKSNVGTPADAGPTSHDAGAPPDGGTAGDGGVADGGTSGDAGTTPEDGGSGERAWNPGTAVEVDNGADIDFAVAPDEQHLVVVRRATGADATCTTYQGSMPAVQLWAVATGASAGSAVSLAHRAWPWSTVFSPDSKYLAWIDNDADTCGAESSGTLHFANIDGSSPRTVASRVHSLHFAGDNLVYTADTTTSGDPNLYAVAPAGAPVDLGATDRGYDVENSTGTSVVFTGTSSGDAYLESLSGTGRTTLTPGGSDRFVHGAWSPDGSFFVYAHGDPSGSGLTLTGIGAGGTGQRDLATGCSCETLSFSGIGGGSIVFDQSAPPLHPGAFSGSIDLVVHSIAQRTDKHLQGDLPPSPDALPPGMGLSDSGTWFWIAISTGQNDAASDPGVGLWLFPLTGSGFIHALPNFADAFGDFSISSGSSSTFVAGHVFDPTSGAAEVLVASAAGGAPSGTIAGAMHPSYEPRGSVLLVETPSGDNCVSPALYAADGKAVIATLPGCLDGTVASPMFGNFGLTQAAWIGDRVVYATSAAGSAGYDLHVVSDHAGHSQLLADTVNDQSLLDGYPVVGWNVADLPSPTQVFFLKASSAGGGLWRVPVP